MSRIYKFFSNFMAVFLLFSAMVFSSCGETQESASSQQTVRVMVESGEHFTVQMFGKTIDKGHHVWYNVTSPATRKGEIHERHTYQMDLRGGRCGCNDAVLYRKGVPA